MPTIFEQEDLPVAENEGGRIATLANSAMLGTNALQVERVLLEGSARSPMYGAANTERFVYVVRGKGQAQVSEQAFPLEAESVLWLEREDAFYLEADSGGLVVLLCHAPAKE